MTIERKYGPGAYDQMTARLTALGAEDGIDYRFDRALRVNTTDAHRLLAWAWSDGGQGSQDALAERLFRAYFSEGANIADHATLVHLVAECGLDGIRAGEVLARGEFAAEVAEELGSAAQGQITGVPAFVIENRFMIPGAQDVETFVAVLTQARERLTPAATPAPTPAPSTTRPADRRPRWPASSSPSSHLSPHLVTTASVGLS